MSAPIRLLALVALLVILAASFYALGGGGIQDIEDTKDYPPTVFSNKPSTAAPCAVDASHSRGSPSRVIQSDAHPKRTPPKRGSGRRPGGGRGRFGGGNNDLLHEPVTRSFVPWLEQRIFGLCLA